MFPGVSGTNLLAASPAASSTRGSVSFHVGIAHLLVYEMQGCLLHKGDHGPSQYVCFGIEKLDDAAQLQVDNLAEMRPRPQDAYE